MSKPEDNVSRNKINTNKKHQISEKGLKVNCEPAHLRSKNKKANKGSLPHPRKCYDFTYRREKDLPPLIALWPNEIEDKSINGTERVIAKLSAALRAERNRGKSGHWSYDMNRHIALSAALKEEQKRHLSLK